MLIQTDELSPETPLPPHLKHQVYCSLDCAVMSECFEEISHTFNQPPAIYAFEKELQAPYLDIMLRGFLIDQVARQAASKELRARIEILTERLNTLALAVWSRPLVPAGHKLPHWSVLQDFFYSAMKLPEVWISQKGVRKLSTNREALEKLEKYLYARPFVSLILAIRDLRKQLDVFETEIDPDGRYRTSYNIAGTETGRPSSSSNAWGTGGNAQNISPHLRYPFIADRGWKLAVIDLEQVEARDVGFFIGCLFDDWEFLDACEIGDLHTNNARRIWPELGWTDDFRQNRQIAERNFYREFSYRDMAKRGSHLSNYMGTAWTASRHLKVPLPIMEEFQARYCRGRDADPKRRLGAIVPAFPGIPKYWRWCAQQLQTLGILETPFGRRRHFFGRPDDDTTLREAIAFMPQSTTADRMNLGLVKVWKAMPQVQLLAQTYDSITFQYRESEDEREVIAEALALIRVELLAPSGRSYVVPGEAKVGWNWGYYTDERDRQRALKEGKRPPLLNLDGLRKLGSNGDDRTRAKVGLERIML